MKKSEVYHLAQIAVLDSPMISKENKVEILRILFQEEDMAKWVEQQEEKNNG